MHQKINTKTDAGGWFNPNRKQQIFDIMNSKLV